MRPWLDTHYVKVQDLPKSTTNKVTFRSRTFSESGYLSYSATGTVQVCISAFNLYDFTQYRRAYAIDPISQGGILYAYYGREDDLRTLQDLGIDMKDRVLLIRAGKNSYAEKVGGFLFHFLSPLSYQ